MFRFKKPKDSIMPSIKILTDKANQAYDEYVESKDAKIIQEKAFSVAYQISMPLLASAQQQDEKRFFELLPKMQYALQNMSDNALAAWLWGRIYAATNNIGVKAYSAKTNAEKQLKTLLTSEATEKNAFSAWAWGYYLADTNNGEYKEYNQAMFAATANLSTKYKAKKAQLAEAKEVSDKDKKELQNLSTDAMWGWVMALQAAANNAHLDKTKQYNKILQEMQEMTGQDTVAAALAAGLTADDYPAWAVSIVRLAAATVDDKALYLQLEKPLKDSIVIARTSGHMAEEVLAQLNSNLAIAHWSENHSEKDQNHKCAIL